MSARKSDFGDQSEAASHKTGCSPEGEKSGSNEVPSKKRSEAAGFVELGSKILSFDELFPLEIQKTRLEKANI